MKKILCFCGLAIGVSLIAIGATVLIIIYLGVPKPDLGVAMIAFGGIMSSTFASAILFKRW